MKKSFHEKNLNYTKIKRKQFCRVKIFFVKTQFFEFSLYRIYHYNIIQLLHF